MKFLKNIENLLLMIMILKYDKKQTKINLIFSIILLQQSENLQIFPKSDTNLIIAIKLFKFLFFVLITIYI